MRRWSVLRSREEFNPQGRDCKDIEYPAPTHSWYMNRAWYAVDGPPWPILNASDPAEVLRAQITERAHQIRYVRLNDPGWYGAPGERIVPNGCGLGSDSWWFIVANVFEED